MKIEVLETECASGINESITDMENSVSNYYSHPTAVIDNGAIIGTGSKLWHNVHVMEAANIGKECVLGQNVFVANKVILGDRVKVQNNVSIFSGVICEDDTFLGPSMVFTNVINPRSAIDRHEEFKETILKKGASIGANASIICGTVIGEYAFIGASAIVVNDVNPFELIVGNPGRAIGWMSKTGKRLFFDTNGVALCDGETYKLIDGLVKIEN